MVSNVEPQHSHRELIPQACVTCHKVGCSRQSTSILTKSLGKRKKNSKESLENFWGTDKLTDQKQVPFHRVIKQQYLRVSSSTDHLDKLYIHSFFHLK